MDGIGLLFRRVLKNLAAMESIVVVYLVYFNVNLLMAPPSPEATTALWVFGPMLVCVVLGVLLARGELVSQPRVRAGILRGLMLFGVLGTYFALRYALAALNPELLDLQLASIDRAVFGVVPAQWMESFSSVVVTEWFAFFYYCFFLILALSILPAVLFGSGARSRELLLGSIAIVCVAGVVYTLVPGQGPYAVLEFQEELVGGFFWGLVLHIVETSGPLLDIFPSLHTALPSFYTIHAFTHRKDKPFRVTWPILAFFTLNIMLATIYLRWHYAVDVVAGVALAGAVAVLVPRLTPSDEERRRSGKQPILEPFLSCAWLSKREPEPASADD